MAGDNDNGSVRSKRRQTFIGQILTRGADIHYPRQPIRVKVQSRLRLGLCANFSFTEHHEPIKNIVLPVAGFSSVDNLFVRGPNISRFFAWLEPNFTRGSCRSAKLGLGRLILTQSSHCETFVLTCISGLCGWSANCGTGKTE
jgi:hypothetical protein